MARKTFASAIRKNKSEYYRLMAFEARENERIHHMKKRIKLLAEDEKNSLALQVYLTSMLVQVQQQKTELEQTTPSKERNKTLKKVEKEYKDIDKKYKLNAYHLAVIETKKEKDNVARLIIKEAKRDEIRVRAQAAYTAWKYFEQLLQVEQHMITMLEIQHIQDNEVNTAKSAPTSFTNVEDKLWLCTGAHSDTMVESTSQSYYPINPSFICIVASDIAASSITLKMAA